jgi:hypothetical protein
METMVIDTVVEDNLIRIPPTFNNRRVKVIIIDSEEEKKKKKSTARKLNFKIDESLEDVIPFSDIEDSAQFAKKLRENHWK